VRVTAAVNIRISHAEVNRVVAGRFGSRGFLARFSRVRRQGEDEVVAAESLMLDVVGEGGGDLGGELDAPVFLVLTE
jgi:hypothetical protein